jgi:hypothetical protein
VCLTVHHHDERISSATFDLLLFPWARGFAHIRCFDKQKIAVPTETQTNPAKTERNRQQFGNAASLTWETSVLNTVAREKD